MKKIDQFKWDWVDEEEDFKKNKKCAICGYEIKKNQLKNPYKNCHFNCWINFNYI